MDYIFKFIYLYIDYIVYLKKTRFSKDTETLEVLYYSWGCYIPILFDVYISMYRYRHVSICMYKNIYTYINVGKYRNSHSYRNKSL